MDGGFAGFAVGIAGVFVFLVLGGGLANLAIRWIRRMLSVESGSLQ